MSISKLLLGTILFGAIVSYQHGNYSTFNGFRNIAAESESAQVQEVAVSGTESDNKGPSEDKVQVAEGDAISSDNANLIDTLPDSIVSAITEGKIAAAEQDLAEREALSNKDKPTCDKKQIIDEAKPEIKEAIDVNHIVELVMASIKKDNKDKEDNKTEEVVETKAEKRKRLKEERRERRLERKYEREERLAQRKEELEDKMLENFMNQNSGDSNSFLPSYFKQQNLSNASMFDRFNGAYQMSAAEFFALRQNTDSKLTADFSAMPGSMLGGNTYNYNYSPAQSYQTLASNSPALNYANASLFDSLNSDRSLGFDSRYGNFDSEAAIIVPSFGRNNKNVSGYNFNKQ